MKKWLVLSALAAALYGCGDSSPDTAGAPAAADPAPVQAETGTVTFQIQFPTSEVAKSRLDDRTKRVQVYFAGPTSIGTEIIPDANGVGTATVELIAGRYTITADAMDALSGGNILDRVSASGHIVSGDNTVYLTFLQGEWTFAEPIVLTDGKVLSQLLLKNFWDTWDGWTTFESTWLLDNGTALTPQNYDDFEMSLAFDGSQGANWSSLYGEYNLTNPGDYDLAEGDRVLMIAPNLMPWEDIQAPDTLDPYLNTQVVDGATISGTLLELTFVSETSVPVDPPTGMCDENAFTASVARAAALQKAVAGPRKAGDPLGDVTVVYSECDDYIDPNDPYRIVEITVTEVWSNVTAHPFTATGTQYVPPSGGTTVVIQ